MTFEQICDNIERKRRQLDLEYGWRFLYVPRRNLVENNGFLILGLNPGGRSLSGQGDIPVGNAYLDEEWRSMIQKKFIALMAAVAGENGWWGSVTKDILNNSVTSNVIPFISPQIDEFGDHLFEIMEFSKWLWTCIISDIKPKVILTIGHTPGEMIFNAIGDISLTGKYISMEVVKENRQSVKIFKYEKMSLVSIPHLAHWAAHCDKPKLIKAVASVLREVYSPGIRCAT